RARDPHGERFGKFRGQRRHHPLPLRQQTHPPAHQCRCGQGSESSHQLQALAPRRSGRLGHDFTVTLRDTPIRRKLMIVILMTSVVVMVVMRVVFFAYEFFTFREATLRQLSMIGEIIATNSTASLAFDNPDDAAEILSALKTEQHISAACLYDRNNQVFSRYP